MSAPREEWEWSGHAGHFILASQCRFHLCTVVGPWIVSTVGEYLPDAPVRESLAKSRGIALEGIGDARLASWMEQAGYEEIGFGRKYETMVFPAGERCEEPTCNCGARKPSSWSELEADGYNDAGSATRGHYEMCEKWAAIEASVTA